MPTYKSTHISVYNKKRCEIYTILFKNSPHQFFHNTIDLHFCYITVKICTATAILYLKIFQAVHISLYYSTIDISKIFFSFESSFS